MIMRNISQKGIVVQIAEHFLRHIVMGDHGQVTGFCRSTERIAKTVDRKLIGLMFQCRKVVNLMGNNGKPWLNDSGCPDPTAYDALKPIIKEEKELEKKVRNLVAVLKLIADWAGFEFTGRIQLKHKKTGKEFK